MSKPVPVITLSVLAALVLGSALWVVDNKQTHRRLTNQRDQLRAAHQGLEQEWAQLQLEEAALANHARVERAARERWGMTDPAMPVIISDSQPKSAEAPNGESP